MAKKMVVVALLVVLFPAVAAAQCRPTKKERTKGALILGAIGAILGAAVSHNHGYGAAIGGGLGAGLGAATAKDPTCVAREREAASYNPYDHRIASANARTHEFDKIVELRSVSGADEQTLEPVLTEALANLDYGLADRRAVRQITAQSRGRMRFQPFRLMDITVRQVAGINGANGGGFSRALFSTYGNQVAGGGVYQVSVTMIDPSTGSTDPARSAMKNVQSIVYAASSGYTTISTVSGWGSVSYYTSDPQTAAAEAAITYFFGVPTKPPQPHK